MHKTVGGHSNNSLFGRITEVYRVAEIVIRLSETTGGRRPRYPQRFESPLDARRMGCSSWPHSFEHRPAAVFFVAPCPLHAGVVEQPLTDIFPNRVRTVEPSGIRLLDLDDPGAAAATHPQNAFGNLA